MQVPGLSSLIEVPASDPDDARRRRLLNILSVGITGLALLTVFAALIASITMAVPISEIRLLVLGGLSLSGGIAIIWVINRYWSGTVASILFLIVFIVVFSLTEEPRQIVEGRSTFMFTVPILIASVILRPWASFVMAGVTSAVNLSIAVIFLPEYSQGSPPIPTMLGFFTFAFVAWLSSRSLENALAELRTINRELDQRVEDRTRELREANNRLKEIDRLKSRFVAMVSHELRTPLSAIRGFTEMLQAGIYGAMSERQAGALDRIFVNTEQLLHLVNDLLDQARIEAGQISLKPVPFAPANLVEDVRSTLAVLAENRGIDLITEVDPDLPETLYGDEQRLKQILVNLANNAIKFTREGSVTVRIFKPDPEHWAMSISDTGIGIPEDARDYIFEPFRQVDSSITRQHKGSGMGLAIVRQIVQIMEGSVSVESAVGEGSTFTVQLPITVAGGS